MNAKACIKSMRLRTLPLSEAGVVLGIFLSSGKCIAGGGGIVFLLLTTALLQILSNLSNELGDTLSGTDAEGRQGIRYSLQDGEMTIPQMKKLIAAVAAACCLSGLAMIFFSFGFVLCAETVGLVLLGAASVWAAMHYTLGKSPYGYRGLGDLFVFIFFGLVSVCGSFYVCTHSFDLLVLIPACGIGLLSIGVLNVNNIRDMKTDASTRTTVALKLGLRGSRIYQTVLIVLGWSCLFVYTVLSGKLPYLLILSIPLFAKHLKGIWTREDRSLDPMLPLLVVSTFISAILTGVSVWL